MSYYNSKKIEKVKAAISEAERFILAAVLWESKLSERGVFASKEGGAAKRASMDLTRALANMRRA